MPIPEEETTEAREKGSREAPPEPGKTPPVEQAAPVKRPRGRPRKHPLPILGTVAPGGQALDPSHPDGVQGHVAVPSGDSSVESALLLHTVGAPARAETAPAGPAPIKRPRGRPRKHPLQTAPAIPARPDAPPAASLGGTAILTQAPGAVAAIPPATTGDAAVILKRPRGRPRKHPISDAGGISGGVSVPSEEAGQPGLIGERRVAGLVAGSKAATEGRPRGRRRKVEPSILNPFCPECGTYLRMFRPPRGRWRKVCPRCEPERMVVKRDYRDYIDKTGMPCKDRGKCRPERCVKALECEEMGRYR